MKSGARSRPAKRREVNIVSGERTYSQMVLTEAGGSECATGGACGCCWKKSVVQQAARMNNFGRKCVGIANSRARW